MWLEQTAAPQKDALSIDEAKRQLRILGNDQDTQVQEYLRQAVAWLDGRGGLLNRALITQSWEYRIHTFPLGGAPIHLPLPPLQSVESVRFLEQDGSEVTVNPDLYEVETQTRIGMIRQAFNATWPTPRHEPFAVRIKFTAGYGEDPGDVPAPIRAAIKLVLTHFYEKRGAVDPAALHGALDSVAGSFQVRPPW
jgi:uncharacterized phiE125 gp8 family phage protein